MRAVFRGFVLVASATSAALSADISTTEARRIQEAATVLKEIHAVRDKDIPTELWERASCVLVVPSLKKAQMKAEILSYSRAQGLFAGVNLSGGVIKPNLDDNVDLYGPDVAPREVLMGTTIAAPAATEPFMTALRLENK
jgi:lipid-binding SYLF domain-containing protein